MGSSFLFSLEDCWLQSSTGFGHLRAILSWGGTQQVNHSAGDGAEAGIKKQKKNQPLDLATDATRPPLPKSLFCGTLPGGGQPNQRSLSSQAASGVACSCRLGTVSRLGRERFCERCGSAQSQSSSSAPPAVWRVAEDQAWRLGWVL